MTFSTETLALFRELISQVSVRPTQPNAEDIWKQVSNATKELEAAERESVLPSE